MSTKIYNVWLTTKSLRHVMRTLQWMKSEMEQNYRQVLRNYADGGSDPEWFLGLCFHAADSIMVGYRDMNPAASAVVYAHPQQTETPMLLVQTFGVDDSELTKRFVRRIKGADFHYQNQVDQPDDMSNAQWRERGRIWDRLLPGSGNPSENGLSFDMITKRRALELLFSELRLALPPLNRPEQDGKPWEAWGPDCAGMFVAQDYEWARKRNAVPEFKQKIIDSWLRPSGEEQSMHSANL